MQPFRFLTNAFINTFGITRPTLGQERHASFWIVVLLAAVLLLVGVVAVILRLAFQHG